MAGLWPLAANFAKGVQNYTHWAVDKTAEHLEEAVTHTNDLLGKPYEALREGRWGQYTSDLGDRHWNLWGRRAAFGAAGRFFGPKVAATLSAFHQPGPGVRYRWDQNLITPSVARSLGYQAASTAVAMANFHSRTPRRPWVRPVRQPVVKYRYSMGGFGPKPKWKQNYYGKRKRKRYFFKK